MPYSSGILGSYDIPNPAQSGTSELNNELDRGQENMFRVALLSKQIELQQKARMSELQQQHEFSILPKGAGAGALSILGVPQEKANALEALFPQGMDENTLRSLGETLGMQARANALINKPIPHTTQPDANNLVMTGFISPNSPIPGGWLAPPGTQGGPMQSLNPKDHEELNKIDNQVGNAKNMLQQINGLAQKVLPSVPSGVPLNMVLANAQKQGLPIYPQLKEFTDLIGGLQAQYQKDSTGMAPRSMQLMQMEAGTFPMITDDKTTALGKTQYLNTTWDNKQRQAHLSYDPSSFLPSSQNLNPSKDQVNSVTNFDPEKQAMSMALQDWQRRQALKKSNSGSKNGQ